MAAYNERGEEIPDPTPVALPSGYAHPEPLVSIIERLIDSRLAREVLDTEDTLEEAEDFDVEDDDGDLEFQSQYEWIEMDDELGPDEAPSAEAGDSGEVSGAPAGHHNGEVPEASTETTK